jgi:hypothetical protein
LPPDDRDDSFSDAFVDSNEPEPSDFEQPADIGEFGWRLKSPRITTPLIWRLVPIPVTLQRRNQPPAPAVQLTPRRLVVSPPHRAAPDTGPTSTHTQRRPKRARKVLKNLEMIQEEL